MAQISNLPGVKRALREKAMKKVELMKTGFKRAGAHLLTLSNQIVPVHLGKLKASGRVEVAKETANTIDVAVGYHTKYAIYVHENLDAAHGAWFNTKYAAEIKEAENLGLAAYQTIFIPRRGANQQAKFLETPFRRARQDLLDIVAYTVQTGK